MLENILSQWSSGVGEIHLALALGLLLTVNWIGRHSVSVGYTSISMFVQDESAPAFNFVLRVFSPIVYLIIASSILYAINLDHIVKNLYFVSVYYIIIQLFVVAIQGRIKLLSWRRQLLYSVSIIFFSYLSYDKFISVKKNILPDFSNVANELWIIVILFIYKIVNELNMPEEASEKRKIGYQNTKFREFSTKYGRLVDGEIKNDKLKAVVYAIMIHENFNRPTLVRWIENTSFYLTGKPHTLGIMQVRSSEYINDKQSVILGSKKVREAYETYCSSFISDKAEYYQDYNAISSVVSDYNVGEAYNYAVTSLAELIIQEHYKNTAHSLNPMPGVVPEIE